MGMNLEEWKGFIITSITAQFYVGILANYAILKPDIAEELNFAESYIGIGSFMFRPGRND